MQCIGGISNLVGRVSLDSEADGITIALTRRIADTEDRDGWLGRRKKFAATRKTAQICLQETSSQACGGMLKS